MSGMKVGLAGLVLMGSGMATRLINSGFDLTVYNRSRSKAERFSVRAKVAETPAELAGNCDLVITVVTDFEALQEVMLGNDGIVNARNSSLIVADASTISPDQSNSNAIALRKKRYRDVGDACHGRTRGGRGRRAGSDRRRIKISL